MSCFGMWGVQPISWTFRPIGDWCHRQDQSLRVHEVFWFVRGLLDGWFVCGVFWVFFWFLLWGVLVCGGSLTNYVCGNLGFAVRCFGGGLQCDFVRCFFFGFAREGVLVCRGLQCDFVSGIFLYLLWGVLVCGGLQCDFFGVFVWFCQTAFWFVGGGSSVILFGVFFLVLPEGVLVCGGALGLAPG